ncbi:MAG: ATP-binding protein [Actinomycetota bacterium]|nr:ATP-binding protein [Actinomycetota bacterium]
MIDFVGRDHEIATLAGLLDQIRSEIGTARPGRCLLMRGRRRIGKSALTEEFVLRSGVPTLFYAAAGGSADAELAQFLDDAASSALPGRAVLSEIAPTGWNGALQVLADALPVDAPSVVVIDEVPYLMDQVEGFEGHLQRAWDRFLCRKPVLLILIGSDLAMMNALNSYDRPFHQRGTEMVIGPLNPAEISSMLGLDAAAAFDATLVTGGLPLVCGEWPRGASIWTYLEQALSNQVSALLVSGERSLAAEFPIEVQAREVLRAIGSGERTFTNIARASGGINHTSLTRSLDRLTAKGIVAGELPASLMPSRERRYRIADPYLRFWLRFLEPHMLEIERRRGDLALRRIQSGWGSYRGRAIEPTIREALARLLPDDQLPAAPVVGGYWTRSNEVEIDLVGADRSPVATRLFFVGSIKWQENVAFDRHDEAALMRHRSQLTDEPVPVVAVSRSGIDCSAVDARYTPEDLIKAWRPGQAHI